MANLLGVLKEVTLSLTILHRQLASLSAKVQAYEDVISKLSTRFGVSDEHLVNIALAVVWNLDLDLNRHGLTISRNRLQT